MKILGSHERAYIKEVMSDPPELVRYITRGVSYTHKIRYEPELKLLCPGDDSSSFLIDPDDTIRNSGNYIEEYVWQL